jgi:putative phosphoribosyl transferase
MKASLSGAGRSWASIEPQPVQIPVDGVSLEGDLVVPADAAGIVLFAHGSGSSCHSPRNQAVARVIQRAGLGTLLLDLLAREEEAVDALDGRYRFNVRLLARRLVGATIWIASQPPTAKLEVGYFGSSTGAAAALIAASQLGAAVGAVVSYAGRPDLAGPMLSRVVTPTMLIVGERDEVVLDLNRKAYVQLSSVKRLVVVPGATHLFDEWGALEKVATLASDWCAQYLRRSSVA